MLKIRKGLRDRFVKLIQREIGVRVDGVWGEQTERGLEKRFGEKWKGYLGVDELIEMGILIENRLDLVRLVGDKLPKVVLNELPNLRGLGGTNPIQWIHFFAQTGHESGGFIYRTENLNYSINGLLKTWPEFFTITNAWIYANKPEQIANRVYANRMGNGDEKSGDGWKFRGRGFIQITGRANYEDLSKWISIDLLKNPNWVSVVAPLWTAYWWFWRNEVWDLCIDLDENSIRRVTQRINGGLNGLNDRIERTKFWTKIFYKD